MLFALTTVPADCQNSRVGGRPRRRDCALALSGLSRRRLRHRIDVCHGWRPGAEYGSGRIACDRRTQRRTRSAQPELKDFFVLSPYAVCRTDTSRCRRVKARGMQIARYENGKLVERWGSPDELGILKHRREDQLICGEVHAFETVAGAR